MKKQHGLEKPYPTTDHRGQPPGEPKQRSTLPIGGPGGPTDLLQHGGEPGKPGETSLHKPTSEPDIPGSPGSPGSNRKTIPGPKSTVSLIKMQHFSISFVCIVSIIYKKIKLKVCKVTHSFL